MDDKCKLMIKKQNVRKIVILAFTAAGHLNTILKLTKELLLDSSNLEIIIYGIDEYKHLIERSGAKFKCYKNLKIDSFKPPPLNNRKRLGYVLSIDQLFQITEQIIRTLEYEIEMEDPDLLLYDHFSVFGMWVVRSMRQKYQQYLDANVGLKMLTKRTPKPPPLAVMYHTSFAFFNEIYPNYVEQSVMDKQDVFNRIKIVYYKIKICIVQLIFCLKLGLKFEYLNPLHDFMSHKENLNLVFNLPELHPRSHMYDSSFKFVGPCIDPKLHDSGNCNQSFDSSVSSILENFQPIDRENVDNTKPILIYFSLGTVFNDNLNIFKTIIDGICLYLKRKSSLTKKIKVLISSGGLNENERINDLIVSNEFKDSIVVCKTVPQLEILERCSLFITHCGMNSINEAVYYGCPMICLPLSYDQPLIAYRVTDELGLGVQIDFVNLKPISVQKAMEKILFNVEFQKRCANYSKLSKSCMGQKNAAKIILEYLKLN